MSETETLQKEAEVFEPSADFVAQATVSGRAAYDELRAKAESDPMAFWAEQAEKLHWFDSAGKRL